MYEYKRVRSKNTNWKTGNLLFWFEFHEVCTKLELRTVADAIWNEMIIKHIEKLLRFRRSTTNHHRPRNNGFHTLSCFYFIKAAKATYFAWEFVQKSSLRIKSVGTDVLEIRTFVVITALGLLDNGETWNICFAAKSTSQPGTVHMHLTCCLPSSRIEPLHYVCKSKQNDRYGMMPTERLRLKANVDGMFSSAMKRPSVVFCIQKFVSETLQIFS